MPDWQCRGALCEFDQEATSPHSMFSTVRLRIKLARNFKAHVIRTMSYSGFVAMLGLGCFFMDIEGDFGERFATVAGLILTLVASQFVVNSQLPQVPYFTFIDKYMLMGFFFLIAVAVQSVIVSDNDVDMICAILFSLIFILMQGSFACYAYEKRQLPQVPYFALIDKYML